MTVTITKEKLLPVELNQLDKIALRQQLAEARQRVLKKIDRNRVKFEGKFPAETCENNHFALTENIEWTTSFWSGQLWLAWEMTSEEKYLLAAEQHIHSFGN